MTSKECFVYITLPGETKFVTAGKFSMSQGRDGNLVGAFVYGKKYQELANAVVFDPVELRNLGERYETSRLGGVFGAIRDASPDYWGRRLIEKHAGKPLLDEIGYLLESPDDRAGALGFGLAVEPVAQRRNFNKTIDLAELQRIAEALIREENQESAQTSVQVEELLLINTSMGGARPKAVVEDDKGLWIAKFSRPDDRWNNPRVEHAMMELAKQCGINVARTRIESVAGRDVLLVRRFDQEKTNRGYMRARMVSGLTLLRSDDSMQSTSSWSYLSLAEELRKVLADHKADNAELFRRMCFNALISNLDDHPRNHAIIALDRKWKLSPAYDLTPSPVVSLERRDLAMVCGDMGRFANTENLLTQSGRFGLERPEATVIITRMIDQVRVNWYSTCRSSGVSEKDTETIKSAFVYPGFNT